MIARRSVTVMDVYRELGVGECLADTTRELREYQFARWSRFTADAEKEWAADPSIAEITTDRLKGFQTAATAGGMSGETIECTINAVMTVLRAAEAKGMIDRVPRRPKRLVCQPTRTRRLNLGEFDRFLAAIPEAFEHCRCRRRSAEWWLTFWAVIYFTALRLRNVTLLDARQVGGDVIEVRQFKTGALVEIPVHPVLRRMLAGFPSEGPLVPVDRKSLYRLTHSARAISGVRGITPQAVRMLAARQFNKACPGAGRLILGRKFPGADSFYFDPLEFLQSAVEKLAVPSALMTPEEREGAVDSEKVMLGIFRSLSRDDQATLMTVAASLRR